jgi:L-lactate dehydrogenase complex protein LldF
VYSGPMGAVLTPSLIGVAEAGHLPNASTFCGRCESVCPVKIPLPKLMRQWRQREFAEKLNPLVHRAGVRLWAWTARQPALYHALVELVSRVAGWSGRGRGRFRAVPLAAGWTTVRDMPSPEGRSFHSLWVERDKGRAAK